MSISRKNPRKNKPPKRGGSRNKKHSEAQREGSGTVINEVVPRYPRKLPSLKLDTEHEKARREKAKPPSSRKNKKRSGKVAPIDHHAEIKTTPSPRKNLASKSLRLRKKVNNRSNGIVTPPCVAAKLPENNRLKQFSDIFKNKPKRSSKVAPMSSSLSKKKNKKNKQLAIKNDVVETVVEPFTAETVAVNKVAEKCKGPLAITDGKTGTRRSLDESRRKNVFNKLRCCFGEESVQVVDSIEQVATNDPSEGGETTEDADEGSDDPDPDPDVKYGLEVESLTPESNSSCSINIAVTPAETPVPNVVIDDGIGDAVGKKSEGTGFKFRLIVPKTRALMRRLNVVKFVRKKLSKFMRTSKVSEPVIIVKKKNGVSFNIDPFDESCPTRPPTRRRCDTPMPILSGSGQRERPTLAEINLKQIRAAEKRLALQTGKIRPQSARRARAVGKKIDLELMERERVRALKAHQMYREENATLKQSQKEKNRLEKVEAQRKHAEQVRQQKLIQEEELLMKKREKSKKLLNNMKQVNVRKGDLVSSVVYRLHQRNTDILVKAQMKSYEKQVEGTDSGKGSFRGIQPRNENDPLKVNVAPKDGNADDNEDDGDPPLSC